MADSWASKFPAPGLAPAKPTWSMDPRAHDYNKWVRAVRKYNIACAVDTLLVREATGALNAVEMIVLTVGVMILDGSIPDHDTSIFGIFQGPLG